MTSTRRWPWQALVPVLAAFLLQSCATGGASKGVVSASDPSNGTVIARVSIQGFKFVNNYSVLVRRAGATENAFSLQGWSMASDGDTGRAITTTSSAGSSR
jgi:hypothetical protein